MIDSVIQPANQEEQKTNRNLAIWIGVAIMGSFAVLYVLFIAAMFLKPGLLFRLMPMPMPMIIDAALSDGNKTYLVHQKVDMSTFDPSQKRQPQVRHILSVLNGTQLGASQEIPPYAHASGGGNRLLFLSTGVYRIYDGSRWTEGQSDAIGKDPTGLLAPAGVYVLSRHESGPRLSLIAGGTSADIPLPADYLAWYKKEQCPCLNAKLVWYLGRLGLFWKGTDTVSWTIWNGSSWSPPATMPYSGRYEVLSDDRNLYLFLSEGDGPDRQLTYYVLSGDAWSAPMRLPVKGSFMNWNVFIQQGKLKLFTQQFTAQTFSAIEKGALVDPVRLKGPFDFTGMMGMGRMALWYGVTNALSLLAVFGVSAVIARFKKRIWREEDATYEFASLFRRFCAMTIDKLVLLIPPGIIIAFFMHGPDDFEGNPFQFLLPIFSAAALFFVGGYLYHSLLEGLCGQTLGKKLCGIRVLKADFSPCGLQAGLLRNVLRIADAFFYYLVAVIALAASLKWQRIGDLVAETVVVKENR